MIDPTKGDDLRFEEVTMPPRRNRVYMPKETVFAYLAFAAATAGFLWIVVGV
jgi:hypothetical protein